MRRQRLALWPMESHGNSGGAAAATPASRDDRAGLTPLWGKLLDQTRCIGCHACTTACKSENDVPLGVTRTYVKSVEIGIFPAARRAFQVTRCNQCDDAPCVTACPTRAMYRRPDGIVDFDKSVCIGCKACIAACPYDAIFINPDDHSAEKCNFCAHRLDIGLEPACVVVCPTEAIIVGDLRDPSSRIAQLVNRTPVSVRRPEKETRPKLFYRGADQATLDPLAARRPPGGIFAWSQQTGPVVSGHPHAPASSAEALLSYDIGHSRPWGWRVSLYTWTKGLAAGAYLVPLLLLATGRLDVGGAIWRWWAPLLAMAFLGATGALLIWDLKHPWRFYLIFLRPQLRSWIVRGAALITAYGGLLAVHLLVSLAGGGDLSRWLGIAGGPLAAMTAIYTAFLFAQAKARDLWQSPLLPAHLFVQALLAGAAATLLASELVGGGPAVATQWLLSGAALAHLLLIVSEVTLPHGTAHAHLAVREMTRGAYAAPFWAGAALAAVAAAAPLIGPVAVPAALLGLLAYEHAYVQAAQSVPLA
jgi:Fe-S-cluster-containing dehydrogenase component/formate-dependent nitrite reductase membrane component NrfD